MSLRLAVLLVFAPAIVFGADAWVIRGQATTPNEACFPIDWDAYAVVHNPTTTPATLQLVHSSNGVYAGPAIAGTIPARRSVLARDLHVAGPPGNAALWVDHLIVDERIVIEGRLEQLRLSRCAPMGQPPQRRATGKVRMPVFRELIPAGEERVHYGTDLGSVRARINVSVYNAGSNAARATLQVVQPLCAAVATNTTTVEIPPDTIVQVSLGEVVPCPGDDTVQRATTDCEHRSHVALTTRRGTGSCPLRNRQLTTAS